MAVITTIIPKRRHPCGKPVLPPRGEMLEDVIAVAVSQPHRRDQKDPRSRLHGSVISSLFFQREIDGIQFQAAEMYERNLNAMMAVIGAPRENPSGVDLSGVRSAPGAGEPETDAERIKRENETRNRYENMMYALMEAGATMYGFRHQARLASVVRDCVARNMLVDVGDLRLGLNALVNLWQLRQ